MRKIFISYRRAEAEYAAGSLGRELRRHFGDAQVFRDKEDIAGGVSWKQHVLNEIDRDSSLLVLMGKEWTQARDAAGARRLDNPDDPIRLEIADGIRDGAAVIPVLLENAQMPAASELPAELASMTEINALKLRDSDWDADIAKIVKTLEKSGLKPLAEPKPGPDAKPAAVKRSAKAIWSVAIVALIAIGYAEGFDREGTGGALMFALAALALGGFAFYDIKTNVVRGKVLAIVGIAASAVLSLVLLNDLMTSDAPADTARLDSPAPTPSSPPAPVASTPASPPSTMAPLEAQLTPQPDKPKATPPEPKGKKLAAAIPESKIKQATETSENALIGIWYSKEKEEIGSGQTMIVHGTTEYLRNKSATFVGQLSLSEMMPEGSNVEVVYNVIATNEWQLDGNKLTMKLIDVKSVPRSMRVAGQEVDLRTMPASELATLPKLESLIPKGFSSEGEIIETGTNTIKLKTRDSSGRETTIVSQKRDRPFALP